MSVIYAKGHTFWHGVRTFGDMVTTLCGRRLASESVIADRYTPSFLCQTCEALIARSGSVVGA